MSDEKLDPAAVERLRKRTEEALREAQAKRAARLAGESVQLNLRVPKAIKVGITELARRRGTTMAEIVVDALLPHLDGEEP